MKMFRHASLLKSKLDRLKQVSKYRLYALTYGESPYGWGYENLNETDCSGLLCGPLLFMGFKIRINANGLMQKVFTKKYLGFDPSQVQVVFFTDTLGRAKHCGLVVAENVVMHASGARGVTFNSMDDLFDEYLDKGYDMICRNIDWAKVYEVDGEVYDLDEEMV